MWGSNQYGQLALIAEDAPAPVRCKTDVIEKPIVQMALGGGHSLALDAAGQVWSWGWNGKGQLGVPTRGAGGCEQMSSPTRVPGLPKCRKIGAGHETSFAISADGALFSFGAPRGGASPNIDTSGSERAGSVTAETSMHKARDLTEILCSAVYEGAGEVDGDFAGGPQQGLRFKDVDAGVFHAAAVTETGECVCWGKHNASPASSTSSSASSRDRQTPSHSTADEPDDCGVTTRERMGVFVWRPRDGAALVEVACGWQHTVVRDERGRVWGFGANRRGQLPVSGSRAHEGSALHLHAAGGRVRAQGSALQGPVAPDVPIPTLLSAFEPATRVAKVDAGWSHTVFLAEDGRIHASGRSDMGQCSPLPGVWDDVCAGSEMVLARRGTQLAAVGWNEHGNLGVGAAEGLANRFSAGLVLVSPASAAGLVMSAGGAHCGLYASFGDEGAGAVSS